MRHSTNGAMITASHIRMPSQPALSYPAPEEAAQAYTSRELENTVYPPLFSRLLDEPRSRVRLWIRKEPLASFRIQGISKRVPSPALLYSFLSSPCLPSFVVGGATFVHPVAYWALCASDLRRLTRLVMGRRTVWRRDLICSNEARAVQILVLNELQPRIMHMEIEILVAEYQTS